MTTKRIDISDEKYSAAAQRVDATYNRQFIDDLKFVASMDQGRRMLARLIFDVCKSVYGTWEPSAKIHFDAGKRFVGDDILGKLEIADPGATRKMVQEWFGSRQDWRMAVAQEARHPTTDEGDDT